MSSPSGSHPPPFFYKSLISWVPALYVYLSSKEGLEPHFLPSEDALRSPDNASRGMPDSEKIEMTVELHDGHWPMPDQSPQPIDVHSSVVDALQRLQGMQDGFSTVTLIVSLLEPLQGADGSPSE